MLDIILSAFRFLYLRFPAYARWKNRRQERAVRRLAEEKLRTACGLTYARDPEVQRDRVVILVRDAEFALFGDGEPADPAVGAVKSRVRDVRRALDAGTALNSGKVRDELQAILRAIS